MIPVGSGAGYGPTSPGTACTCSPGKQKLDSMPSSFMTSVRTPRTPSRSCSTTGPESTVAMPSKMPSAPSSGSLTTAETWGTDYDISTLSGRRVRGSATPDGLVALLAFLAETQPTRSNNHSEASTSALPTGALFVTTPTAVPTLPSSLDRGSVVVIE